MFIGQAVVQQFAYAVSNHGWLMAFAIMEVAKLAETELRKPPRPRPIFCLAIHHQRRIVADTPSKRTFMKTLLLVCALLSATVRLLAQGTVNFSNATSAYGTNTPDHLVRFGPFAGPTLTGLLVSSNAANVDLSGLRAQLFYGPSTINVPQSLTAVTDAPATFRASSSANAGAWLGGFRTLLGFNPGETVHLNIIVWDVRVSADPFQANQLGYAGFSGIFNYTIPPAGSQPTAYLPSGQLPFLYPGVPEPGSVALLSFGALALLAWRRTEAK